MDSCAPLLCAADYGGMWFCLKKEILKCSIGDEPRGRHAGEIVQAHKDKHVHSPGP